MRTCRPRHRPLWASLALLAALALSPACGKSSGPPAAAKDGGAAQPAHRPKTPLEKEIDKALIFEGALDKAKAALAEAEQATPRDEALIAQRADAVHALEESLKHSRQVIEALRARPQ